ncbi:MAG: PAS domain S-box protein [Oceanospirillales bacterium]|nr:MAG: PAS domain S-box protein [Oceanospirillales bacterium]
MMKPYSPIAKTNRFSRLLIGLSVLALFVVLMMQTAAISRHQALQELQHKTEADLNRYIITVQQKLDRFKDLPKLLSTHPDLLSILPHPDTEENKLRLNLFLEEVNDIIGASDTYLMNREGLTVAASNWSMERSFIGGNFSFRPYFTDAVAGGAGSYFALGTTSQQRGYFFSYPVYSNNEVAGVIVVKIDLNDVEDHWNDPLQDILVTDNDDVIFISTRPDWKFRTLTPLSVEDQRRVQESLRYGDNPLVSLDITLREPLMAGVELVTMKPVIDSSAEADNRNQQQYLLMTQSIENAGLNVSMLSNMKVVDQKVLAAMVQVAFIYIALMLLIWVLRVRYRLKLQQQDFQLREHKALEESEARIRAIIDHTHAGLITLDEAGTVRYMNPTAEKLFGVTADELRGQYLSPLFSEAARTLCWRYIMDETTDTAELTIEADALRKNRQSFPVELTLGRMSVAGEKLFMLTIHDITERKQYEQKLRDATEALEYRVQERTKDLVQINARLMEEMTQHRNTQNELIQTAKLAVLGQLSAGINHELNQPLTAIRNYADNGLAFLERGKLEPVTNNLKEISGLTERMAKIIHPLKEFSRKSTNCIEPVSLKQIRDGVMSVMYGRFEKEQVKVSWPDEVDQVWVMADRLRLEQVFVNLLTNALQAVSDQQDKMIAVTTLSTDVVTDFFVRDNGPGVTDPERVFEPFYTTKSSGQGIGLGLPISQRIIESFYGELTVQNHPEGGAEFCVRLPCAVNPTQQHTALADQGQ